MVLVAQGSLSVSGFIRANGGNGANGLNGHGGNGAGGSGGTACDGNGDLVNVGTVTASAGGVGYILTTVVPNPENLFF